MPTVIFLHGLGRTQYSLETLRGHVEAAGFATWTCTYPSRQLGLEDLACHVAERIRREVGDDELLGVTHSLGGVVLRHARDLLPWRGVVMLAPPNQGSAVARRLGSRPLLRRLLGPSILGLSEDSGWPPPPEPCAVIAGTRGMAWESPPSWLLHGLGLGPTAEPHDGVISVEETRLASLAAFATVDTNHTWIMNHPETRRLVLEFLRTGGFPETGDTSAEANAASDQP